MRIIRLEMAGFGPFNQVQRIDFDAFADEGLFLITGKTGAGKSSILDAITYALYGSIPRYDTTAQRLRSDHCSPHDPSYVELEFTLADTSYLVKRTPEYERPKSRGAGTTVQKPTAELFRRDGDVWVGLGARPVDVAEHLTQILGLTKEQFLQVILLAQNRFQDFLLAKNEERQGLLRTLFSTERFQQIETALVERRKALEARIGSAATRLAQSAAVVAQLLEREPTEAPDREWFATAMAEVQGRLVDAETAAGRANVAYEGAAAERAAVRDLLQRQQRWSVAADRLERLEAGKDAIQADRETVADARRAAILWPLVTGRRDAHTRYRAQLADAVRLTTALVPLDRSTTTKSTDTDTASTDTASTDTDTDTDTASTDTASLDRAELTARIDAHARTLGRLDSILLEEERLPQLDNDITAVTRAIDGFDAQLASHAARRDALPGEIRELSDRLRRAELTAAGLDSAAATLSRVGAAHQAATMAAALTVEHRNAEVEEAAASRVASALAVRVTELLQARLAGYAAELASELGDDAPCPVCGSIDHPAKAEADGGIVTDGILAEARDHAETAAAHFAAATATVRDLTDRLTAARTRSDDKTLAELTVELDHAKAAVSEAQKADTDRAEFATALEELTALRDRAQSGIDELRLLREEATARRAAITATRHGIAQRVSANQDGHGSVADRVAAVKSQLAAASDVAAALLAVDSAAAAEAEAEATLAAHLADHDFAGELTVAEAAVTAARRSSAEIQELVGRVTDFEASLAAVVATLADPDLVDLPAETGDSEELDARFESATTDRDDAVSVVGALRGRLDQVQGIMESVHTEFQAQSSLLEEFGPLRELAGAVQGNEPNTRRMRLETYVLAAQLEQIVIEANKRLTVMSAGRYQIEHDDSLQHRKTQSGLGLSILDQYTGRSRSTRSLSGGETFLASLALALGLAEVVSNQAGGIRLDTLFIDEGFGSLDSDTLEIAMGTLNSLRSNGRIIGLISHVDTMKEQIPTHLKVEATGSGGSRIHLQNQGQDITVQLTAAIG